MSLWRIEYVYTENICAWERALPNSTKFAVAIMNWTRPSPVVEFGNDILNPKFAVGNDSPSTQPVEPVVEMSSETPPTVSPL